MSRTTVYISSSKSFQYFSFVGLWKSFPDKLLFSQFRMAELGTCSQKHYDYENYNFGSFRKWWTCYLFEWGVQWMVVYFHRIVAGSVVGNEECPASVITVVLVTAMENIAVKEQSISCLKLHSDEREDLQEVRMHHSISNKKAKCVL